MHIYNHCPTHILLHRLYLFKVLSKYNEIQNILTLCRGSYCSRVSTNEQWRSQNGKPSSLIEHDCPSETMAFKSWKSLTILKFCSYTFMFYMKFQVLSISFLNSRRSFALTIPEPSSFHLLLALTVK